MKHYDVLIATPGSNLVNGYVKSLTDTLEALEPQGITWKWLNGASSLVHHAREVAMSGDGTMVADDRGPMHGMVTYKKIIWIDSDIVWTPGDFLKIYHSPHEVTTGAYLLSDGVTTSVHGWGKVGGIPKDEIKRMKEVTPVQSIGFGFVGMKYGVFERMPRPWFGHLNQLMHNSRGEQMIDTLGEDISWCVRAHEAKIPIHFDPSILVTHMKTVPMRW